MDAELFFDFHAAALALGKSPCGARRRTGGRVAGQAGDGRESCGQPPGGLDADAGRQPGEVLVDEPGTGQRTGVAPDAAFHVGGGEDFHGFIQLAFDLIAAD